VDGQLWATSKVKGTIFTPAMLAQYTYFMADSVILDFYANGRLGKVAFHIVNPKIGENNRCGLICHFSFITDCGYFLGDNSTNIQITKLDIENHILSGSFNSTAYCENDSSITINITDGRFDMYLYVNK